MDKTQNGIKLLKAIRDQHPFFEEGETVMASSGAETPMKATFLYYSLLTDKYWVIFNDKQPTLAYAAENCEKVSPIKKVTISEIEEKFGCKVEIVNE